MKAKIYTYTIIYSSSEAFKEQVPYVIALVELINGKRIMVKINGYTDNINIFIGMEVLQYEDDEFRFIE